mmetsp:Transcript_1442/g.3260  ORF Transcript_1442/g.3260 Transcript_1442/m.3260 type:complete len:107 (+) Transcript_1442:97-417(+)
MGVGCKDVSLLQKLCWESQDLMTSLSTTEDATRHVVQLQTALVKRQEMLSSENSRLREIIAKKRASLALAGTAIEKTPAEEDQAAVFQRPRGRRQQRRPCKEAPRP